MNIGAQIAVMAGGSVALNLALLYRRPMLALLAGGIFAAAIHWGPK